MIMAHTDGGGRFFEVLASVAGSIALWASHRAQRDPVDDLIAQVRHPLRFACKHPLRAFLRYLR
jgi:hypothetical protein